MKKFICFVLFIILLLSTIAFMPACDKNDGFEIVSLIEFVSNGEKFTYGSARRAYTFESVCTITIDEFKEKAIKKQTEEKNNRKVDYEIIYSEQADTYRLFPNNSFSQQTLNKIKNTVSTTNFYYLDQYDDPTTYYVAFFYQGGWTDDYRNYTHFEQCRNIGYYYRFLLVKIIDNQILQIATVNGIITYTVSSYKITYLE